MSQSSGSRETAARTEDRGSARPLRKVTAPVLAVLPAQARRAVLHAFGRYAPWEDGFDFTPPDPLPGETTGPPDFVGIGAQKSGTTWWYRLIAAHPEVAAREDIHKERHFFDRYVARAFGPDDRARYHGWFPRRCGTITGEWTPDYLHLAWVPALLAEAAPSARLLLMLRDPVERFRSGLSHHLQDRGVVSAEVHRDAVARGFYSQALQRWTRYFPEDQILVLQYERCVVDPHGQLARTYRFLGLGPFVPESLTLRISETRQPVPLDPDARRRLADLYAEDVLALTSSYPELDVDLWPNFSDGQGTERTHR